MQRSSPRSWRILLSVFSRATVYPLTVRAYLLTSTSLAVVSFSLCYAAVSNGVDVAALISNIPGIEVSDNAETAGTVGLAYAIHKAASPIRFPPTVALTPIVAKNVFGKDEAAAEGE